MTDNPFFRDDSRDAHRPESWRAFIPFGVQLAGVLCVVAAYLAGSGESDVLIGSWMAILGVTFAASGFLLLRNYEDSVNAALWLARTQRRAYPLPRKWLPVVNPISRANLKLTSVLMIPFGLGIAVWGGAIAIQG